MYKNLYKIKIIPIFTLIILMIYYNGLAYSFKTTQKTIFSFGSINTYQFGVVDYTYTGYIPERMQLIKDLGAKWVRTEIYWHQNESINDTYFWLPEIDAWFTEANSSGIKILALLGCTTPNWASGSSDLAVPPIKIQDWIDWVTIFMNRYHPSAVEFFNEPAYYWHGTPAQMVEMIKTGYSTVKNIDPNCTVLIGYGGGNPNHYTDIMGGGAFGLETLWSLDIKGYFDALATHPYTGNYLPNTGGPNAPVPGGVTEWYNDLRNWLEAHGLSKIPVWVTEFGFCIGKWDEEGPSLTPEEQASYTIQQLELMRTIPYLNVVIYYSLSNPTTPNFNLLDAITLQKRPVYNSCKIWINNNLN